MAFFTFGYPQYLSGLDDSVSAAKYQQSTVQLSADSQMKVVVKCPTALEETMANTLASGKARNIACRLLTYDLDAIA